MVHVAAWLLPPVHFCSGAAAGPRDTLLALVLFPQFSPPRHTATPVVGQGKQMNTVCLKVHLCLKSSSKRMFDHT